MSWKESIATWVISSFENDEKEAVVRGVLKDYPLVQDPPSVQPKTHKNNNKTELGDFKLEIAAIYQSIR